MPEAAQAGFSEKTGLALSQNGSSLLHRIIRADAVEPHIHASFKQMKSWGIALDDPEKEEQRVAEASRFGRSCIAASRDRC